MPLTSKNFRPLGIFTDDDEYRDIEFEDLSANAPCRNWRLCIGTNGEPTYAMLRRSRTAESSFDHDVQLPAAFVPLLTRAAGGLAA